MSPGRLGLSEPSLQAQHRQCIGPWYLLQLGTADLVCHLLHDGHGVGPSGVLMRVVDFEEVLADPDRLSVGHSCLASDRALDAFTNIDAPF